VIFLSDNDILQKLAACDLLDEMISIFDASKSDFYVLSTLKYHFGKPETLKRRKAEARLGPETVSRVIDFLHSASEITSEVSIADQARLNEIPQIDSGEVILISATASFADFRVLTGDKRCLKALATHRDCEDIARRIEGHVICFEQVLCKILARFDFSVVKAKVIPALSYPQCDTALRAAFGSGNESTRQNTVECLRSYVHEIRNYAVDLLEADP
jgi:hypothetical protein